MICNFPLWHFSGFFKSLCFSQEFFRKTLGVVWWIMPVFIVITLYSSLNSGTFVFSRYNGILLLSIILKNLVLHDTVGYWRAIKNYMAYSVSVGVVRVSRLIPEPMPMSSRPFPRPMSFIQRGLELDLLCGLGYNKHWALVACDFIRARNDLHLGIGSDHDLGLDSLMNINGYGYIDSYINISWMSEWRCSVQIQKRTTLSGNVYLPD